MVDQELVRKINSGRCFVLVGAGPSCEMGYPSWHRLAELTFEHLKKDGLVKDEQSYEVYIEQKKYPELFRLAERDIGNRDKLIAVINKFLRSSVPKSNVIYNLISKCAYSCENCHPFLLKVATYL